MKTKPINYKKHRITVTFHHPNGDETVAVERTFIIKCSNCASDWIRKDGTDKIRNKRMYECKECGKFFPYDKRFNLCLMLCKISLMLNKNYSQAEISRGLKIHSSTVKKYAVKYNLREIGGLPDFQLPHKENQDIAADNGEFLTNYIDVFTKYYDYRYIFE